jgi:predicted flap endonuclease-1-like 5' DNA nuclease
MLKKLFYIGLGISIIVAKKSVSYFAEGREWAGEQIKHVKDAAGSLPEASVGTDSPTSTKEVSSKVNERATMTGSDDLTKINGIGPTYAKRLKEAGITTFATLSEKTPEELRTLTMASGKSADTDSWINQARELS